MSGSMSNWAEHPIFAGLTQAVSGSNENTNGLIRQYLPKKRDLSTVSPQEIDMIMDRLNNRPRKRLGFKIPNQVFLQSLERFAIRR